MERQSISRDGLVPHRTTYIQPLALVYGIAPDWNFTAVALEERGVKYAIRLPANDCLERDIADLQTRPVGRPSHKPVVRYKSFLYQAEARRWWRGWSSTSRR